MQAMELAKMHEMRGECFLAEWFAGVKLDRPKRGNKRDVPRDHCNKGQRKSLSGRAAVRY